MSCHTTRLPYSDLLGHLGLLDLALVFQQPTFNNKAFIVFVDFD